MAAHPPGLGARPSRGVTLTTAPTARLGIALPAQPGAPGVPTPGQLAAEGLRGALAGDQIAVHYEPVVDLRRSEVVGVDCVLRWAHPRHGLLAAELFLPAAESAGVDIELGRRALDAACHQAAHWHAHGLRLEVALPVTLRQLTDPALPDRLRAALAETGLQPALLTLRFPEHLVVDHADRLAAVLAEVRSTGVTMAIDAFGSSYSSPLLLRRLPVGALRVDRSFVSGLGRDNDDDAFVASIVRLAAGLGAVCAADGVETDEQHARLVAAGCDRAQGPLYGRAVPPDEVPRAVDAVEDALAGSVVVEHRGVRHAAPSDDVVASMVRMHRDGASLRTIAAALNQAGSRTASGRRWHPASVARALADTLESAPART